MKNVFLLPWCGAIAFILSACGDTVENVNQMGMDVVSSVDDLPKCTDKNEGEQALVKGETSVRVCVDGEWFATKADEGSSAAPDFSCKTEELKDGSGVKIVCNGDSIGVVLNGEKGEAGENGKGCDVAEYADSLVTIVCGDKSITMNLGAGSISVGTFVPDSEKVAISLDSLAGYSQKGPFLKGSTVYLYELSDGRTLKQTNGNFTSIITRDDGRYKFTARDLASQYAMVVVDGNYRNEVTGKPSNASIRLRALTDMRKRSNVNVNLLTHLEFDRVYYLVTREHKTVKQAKKQAQAEIFNAFHIDTASVSGSAEDLDVFGKTDADAALLAISIMLQGDGSETDLSVLLTEIANDMETDGKWDGPGSDSIRAALADSALSKDEQGMFAIYRSNVRGWGLSTTVPYFEKYIRKFASIENGLSVCGDKNNPVGTVKRVSNPKSKTYYAEEYTDTSSAGEKIRFICVDADSAKWRVAYDIEKDRYNWNPKNDKDGSLLVGQVSGRKMVWDADTLRYANDEELKWNRGCVYDIHGASVMFDGQYSYYKCSANGWEYDFENLNRGTLTYKGQTYKTVGIKTQMWMAENLNYEVEGQSYCYNNEPDSCAKYGRLYTWAAAVGKSEEECGLGKTCNLTGTVQGICPEGWHLPSKSEWETLYSAMDSSAYAMQSKGFEKWPNSTDAYGFSALPAGFRNVSIFDNVGFQAQFWSATKNNVCTNAYAWSLRGGSADFDCNNYFGYSVRCLKDAPVDP